MHSHDFKSIVDADQGPATGLHIPDHIDRASVCAQGHVATMPLGGPPCAPYIPLLHDFPDGQAFVAVDEDNRTLFIALSLSCELDGAWTTDTFEHDQLRFFSVKDEPRSITCAIYVYQVWIV